MVLWSPAKVVASVLALPGSRVLTEIPSVVTVISSSLGVSPSPTEVVASVLELLGATVVTGVNPVVAALDPFSEVLLLSVEVIASVSLPVPGFLDVTEVALGPSDWLVSLPPVELVASVL